MVISSNTLFHFTDSVDNLLSILKYEFYSQVSLENYGDLFSDNPKNSSADFELGVPLVSFCDLPLSQVENHLKFYGNYGIGLKKDWGMKSGINPVLYLHSGSLLANNLNKIIPILLDDGNEENRQLAMSVISFIKIYKGRLYRRGKYSDKKAFYDEKEWRYVPYPFIMEGKKSILAKEAFFNQHILGDINKILKEKFRLSFEPDDIKYIIVERDEEILPMVKKIEEIKGSKYTLDILKKLATRIISSEHIKEDF